MLNEFNEKNLSKLNGERKSFDTHVNINIFNEYQLNSDWFWLLIDDRTWIYMNSDLSVFTPAKICKISPAVSNDRNEKVVHAWTNSFSLSSWI